MNSICSFFIDGQYQTTIVINSTEVSTMTQPLTEYLTTYAIITNTTESTTMTTTESTTMTKTLMEYSTTKGGKYIL